MAPDEIFSYIPTPEHPKRLRQMLPTDAEEGLAFLAYYRDSFINACTKKDQNTADCLLDIIIHLRYRLIKLGEFLEDPASHLFAIYYEQTLPCMIYGTPLKIDFSPACDLLSLMDEIDVDEGICVAGEAVESQCSDVDTSPSDTPAVPVKSVETKKGKKKKSKGKSTSTTGSANQEPIIKKGSKKERIDFFPFKDIPVQKSPMETLPNLNLTQARNKYLLKSTAQYVQDRKAGAPPEDLGHIECDILDCLDDIVVCSRGKEAIKLLEVLHPVDIVQDGTICVKRKRIKVGYEAVDQLFRGCPSSRDWLLSRQL